MKLRELINKLNEELENVKGKEYKNYKEFKNIVSSIINPVLSEVATRRKFKNDIDVIMLSNRELLAVDFDLKEDSINDHKFSGEFISVKINLYNNIDDSLLNCDISEI